MNRLERSAAALVALAMSLLLAAPAAWSDPPSHAPAHGWRDKHDAYYTGYTGDHWRRDYGIREGRCDRREVGTVVGAVIGGVVGASVSKDDNRLVAILIGSALGAIVGREIGRDMDSSDRACFGHALELAPEGQWVRWDGPRPGLVFAVQPGGGFHRDGHSCRRFVLDTTRDGRHQRRKASACQVSPGEWRLLER